VARTGERSPEPKRGGGRFINFLRGSWRELQRVQWPDRTQVAQATAVVIGFVAIAGLFLGAADWLSQRIVDLII
jgi:preprotein translocase subunit SecE